MKILYAEDERSLSMAVAEIMKMEGHEVDAVYDGAEALAHLKNDTYDAAVLDIMMPKADGIEVLKKMREARDYTPVLLLTAKTQVEDRIEGLTLGADDYLGKPFDMRELMARIESMGRRMKEYQDDVLKVGNLTLNFKTLELTSDVTTLLLSGSESRMLKMLIKKTESGCTLEDFKTEVFPESPDTAAAALYLSYLKNKLNILQSEKQIQEIKGIYYLM